MDLEEGPEDLDPSKYQLPNVYKRKTVNSDNFFFKSTFALQNRLI